MPRRPSERKYRKRDELPPAQPSRAAKRIAKATKRGIPVVNIPPGKTQRERVADFVREYKKTGDLTLSCYMSGLSGGAAKDLIACHPELREDISNLLARCGVTPELIATELRRIASYDPRQMLDENGNVRPMQEWPDDLAHAVSGMDVTERTYHDRDGDPKESETTHKPRFADKLGPLRELARMSAMTSDRLEIANPKGEKFSINNDGPTETRDQIIASLLSMIVPKKDPPPADRKSTKK